MNSRTLGFIDRMISSTTGVKGKGFYIEVEENYDPFGFLEEVKIADSCEPEEVDKMKHKIWTAKQPWNGGNHFDGRDMIELLTLGMRLGAKGYDHVVMGITQTRQELE